MLHTQLLFQAVTNPLFPISAKFFGLSAAAFDLCKAPVYCAQE